MPERPLTIATYAAGASLAAITLVYVFGPTFFLDDAEARSSRSSRKKSVVGLVNPANDCFINSVLQALAGLPALRIYLIREVHRRALDGKELYADLAGAHEQEAQMQNGHGNGRHTPDWKLLSMQQAHVTVGLKDVLDALNERPIYKKTISAQAFIHVVEQSFRTRVNRSQQDAQEFLQIIAERLDDEYWAGRRVRTRARRAAYTRSVRPANLLKLDAEKAEETDLLPPSARLETRPRDSKIPTDGGESPTSDADAAEVVAANEEDEPEETAFPFEGKLESQVECEHCQFKPNPSSSSFVTLTLHVPQQLSSTTLNTCFDTLLKIEHIEDFICERCRLEHAIQILHRKLTRTTLTDEERTQLESDKVKLETAILDDPEKPPKDVKLPDISTAPRRRITRHTRLARFPRLLAIHLSRSVWDPHATSKNLAKVAFPETLPLGGLLDRKTYRLLSVIMHKGGHNSGHYETFRRQVPPQPFSTPVSLGKEGVYSIKSSPQISASPSPALRAQSAVEREGQPATPVPSTPSLVSPSTSSASSTSLPRRPLDRRKAPPPTSMPLDAIPAPGLPTPPSSARPPPPPPLPPPTPSTPNLVGMGRRRKAPDRWWRISDDKIKECRTGEVLSMQREVYLLFYEVVE